MKKEYKLQDLKTGDIIENRDGDLGIVLAEREAIVYSISGMDYYEDFTDDLLYEGDYRGKDILTVWSDEDIVLDFIDYEVMCGDPVYERHDNIEWSKEAYWEAYKEEQKKLKEERMKNRPSSYTGVIQAFYGNRTGIDFTEKMVDQLILGCLSEEFFNPNERIDRSMIPIPGEEGLVLLYNKYQEEKTLVEKEEWYQKEGYVQKPLAEISELNIKLYSRCLACRVDEENKVASLREEDYEKVMKYLAM